MTSAKRPSKAPPASSPGTQRSMKANRPRDTGLELRFRSALRKQRLLGYRVAPKGVPGRPDVAYTRWKLAVFVHGCFWHRCPVCRPKVPRRHRAFWQRKFSATVERDERKRRELECAGWSVVELWECEVNADVVACVRTVERQLNRIRNRDDAIEEVCRMRSRRLFRQNVSAACRVNKWR